MITRVSKYLLNKFSGFACKIISIIIYLLNKIKTDLILETRD